MIFGDYDASKKFTSYDILLAWWKIPIIGGMIACGSSGECMKPFHFNEHKTHILKKF